MKIVPAIFAAAVALVLQGTFVGASAESTSGECTGMTVTDFIESDAVQNTTSSPWVNLTDARVNFATSSYGCVMITFSGVAMLSSDPTYNFMEVRTLLDGSNPCIPPYSNATFLGAQRPVPVTANSITRICKKVPPGTHVVQASFHSVGGGLVQLNGHVLTVTHN